MILAPNHGSAFIDGVLLSVLLRRKVFLYVRGDVFKNRLSNAVLRSLRLLPIYRVQDIENRNDQSNFNKKTLDESIEILKRKGTLVIFAEGNCVSERRLRPMKNGVIRLCFEMLEKYPEIDLDVVPVGINYSKPGLFRQEVCINFGTPISIKKIEELTKTKKHTEVISEFNSELYNAIEKEMVIIKNPANDILAEQYLTMARNHYKPSFFGFFKKNKKRFIAEKRAANDLNNLAENEPEKFDFFRKKVTDYFFDLNKYKVNDKFFSLNVAEKVFHVLFTIILAVPAIIGYVINYPRVFVTNYFTQTKVKNIEFVDSVMIAVGTVSGIVYFAILFFILLPFIGLKAFFIVIFVRLLGYLYWYWKETSNITLNIIKINFTTWGRSMKSTLKSQRKFILNFFG